MKTTGYVWNGVLGLAGVYDRELYPCGTAFLIGNGLAFTATHILDKPFDKTFQKDYESVKSKFSLVAFQKIRNYKYALTWRVKTANFFPAPSYNENETRPIDISLLELTPHDPKNPPIERYRYKTNFELIISPPEEGEKVFAYGFPNSKIKKISENDEYDEVDYLNYNREIEGVVTKVFPKFRDKGFMTFPCFEIEGEFANGMSGGPIFNDQGQVCGVISSSGINGVSYCSSIWPALGIKVENLYLKDLAKQDIIHAVNYEQVKLQEHEGKFPNIFYYP